MNPSDLTEENVMEVFVNHLWYIDQSLGGRLCGYSAGYWINPILQRLVARGLLEQGVVANQPCHRRRSPLEILADLAPDG